MDAFDTPESIRDFWKQAMAELPKFKIDNVRERIYADKFKIRIPTELLTPEGYIEVHGVLSNLRSELIDIRCIYSEAAGNLSRAIKSMRATLSKFTSGTVKEKEADAEVWLMHLIKLEAEITELDVVLEMRLNNIDSVMQQVSRQFKAVEVGTRNFSLDLVAAKDLQNDWTHKEEDDDENIIQKLKRR